MNAVIATFCLALIVIIWSAVIAQTQSERQETIDNASKQNANLAMAFEEHTIRTIKGVDAAVLFIAHEYARLGTNMDLARYIDDGLIDGKLFRNVGVIDARGDVVLNSQRFIPTNVADREYFRIHVQQDTGKSFISKPVMSRITGKLSMPVTRRITKPDGSFGGIVSAVVDPSYFTDFYQKAELGEHGLVDLIGLDGISRARRTGAVARLETDMSKSSLLEQQAKSGAGSFLSTGRIDGVARYVSFRTLFDYPLIVAVGTSQQEVLAKTSQKRNHDYWIALVFSAIMVSFSALLIATLGRQKRAVAALAGSSAQFRTTFEQAAVGIAHATLDRQYLLVNQKFCDMLGYTRNELLALRSNEVTHSDEQEPEPGDARALAGEIDTYSGEKRYVRKDGSLLWTNRTVSLARDPDGQPLYFIHVVEDISERKRGESALRKQNGLRVLLESLAIAANQAATPEQALRACLSRICSYGKWPIGHVLMFADADYSTAGQTSLWHFGDAERYAEFKRISDPLVIIPDGGGFLARCMASRRPLWITDLSELEDFKRKQVALALGLKTAFVFPVVTGNRVVACLEFFSDLALEPDTALLDVTTNIGAQLGRVDERRQAGRALRESEEQFQQLANNIPQMCWITDASQREVVFLSPAFETITGFAVEAAKANSRLLVKVVHPDDRQRIQAARRNAAIGGYDETFRLVRPDGSIRWVHDRAFPIRDASGEVYRIAGIAEDITGRKHSDERVLHLAHHDALTNLPNRELFYDRLEHALGQAQRRNWTIGVMFIDLDRFKAVNDTLGHGVGDQLLLQAASRLAQCVRADDTVGRLGGDEFAVILSELAREHDGSVVAQKIIDAMAKPFLIDSHEVFITASIGIATCLSGTSNADTLMSNADAAMYDAKKMGKNNYQFYTAAMNERSMEKLLLGKDLRHALARNEFVLRFQPKANLHGGHITGVEALLRWQRPDGRLVQPLEFIPVLEESGLIVLAGEWVLRAACAQINAWQKDGVTLLPIAINLSAKQFHQQDIVAMVMRALLEYDVNPGLLEIEITESAAMHDAKATSATLHKLKALGVRIAIDDFGTGYSSLSYLKRFPIDSLKIDRSFVTDLPGNQDDASIAQAVITMAHALRLKVIAEGVENEAQLEFLAAQGCDEMQGHYFSPPLPAEACAQLIREQRKLPWRPAHDRRLEQGVLTVVV